MRMFGRGKNQPERHRYQERLCHGEPGGPAVLSRNVEHPAHCAYFCPAAVIHPVVQEDESELESEAAQKDVAGQAGGVDVEPDGRRGRGSRWAHERSVFLV